MSRTHAYFLAAGEVWERYFRGDLGVGRRDIMLAELQRKWFAGKLVTIETRK